MRVSVPPCHPFVSSTSSRAHHKGEAQVARRPQSHPEGAELREGPDIGVAPGVALGPPCEGAHHWSACWHRAPLLRRMPAIIIQILDILDPDMP